MVRQAPDGGAPVMSANPRDAKMVVSRSAQFSTVGGPGETGRRTIEEWARFFGRPSALRRRRLAPGWTILRRDFLTGQLASVGITLLPELSVT